MRYPKSAAALARAEAVIPLGAQTFSKSKVAHPHDHPLFLTQGLGANVWDVDGNKYVDCIAGLLPIILGYRDSDVDFAIKAQLDKGISFSLSTELEADVAETLCRLIPCAEKVRFGKNGSDVTAAAVRLARAYTGRDMVLSSGYHGWADTFVGPDPLRGAGVPSVIAEQTRVYRHGDYRIIDDILKDAAACVIIEPETDVEWMGALRRACTATGTVLIFDEIITGFRWGTGGAQQRYYITPDLATFGKAMGNGMPINALVGRNDIMAKLAPPNNIFYSGTFQGETLSLAAAKATLNAIISYGVPSVLEGLGCGIAHEIDSRIRRLDLSDQVRIGMGIIPRFWFKDARIKTLFHMEMARLGVLCLGSINLSLAHNRPSVIDTIDKAVGESLETIKKALVAGTVDNLVEGHIISSTGNVRGEPW